MIYGGKKKPLKRAAKIRIIDSTHAVLNNDIFDAKTLRCTFRRKYCELSTAAIYMASEH